MLRQIKQKENNYFKGKDQAMVSALRQENEALIKQNRLLRTMIEDPSPSDQRLVEQLIYLVKRLERTGADRLVIYLQESDFA